MEQNKIRTYIFYAIGEIALVMIGILLALQVNNWNEDNYRKKQETVILNEILSDLDESEATILSRIKPDSGGVVKAIAAIKILRDHMSNNKAYHDSLDIHFTYLFGYYDVVYKVSGYETLKSYGFDYVGDAEIRKEIGIYYTTIVPQTRQSFEEVRDDFYNYMINFLRKDFETVFTQKDGVELSYFVPSNYESLAENTEFIQSINIYRVIQRIYYTDLLNSLNETRKLKKRIQDYLK